MKKRAKKRMVRSRTGRHTKIWHRTISGAGSGKAREHDRMVAIANEIMDEDRDFLRELARQ